MKVEKEAEKVLLELSESLGETSLKETYYVVEDINVTRKDRGEKLEKKFRTMVKKNAPKMDDEGNFIMEVGKWVE